MKPRLFVSYASEDEESFVNALVDALLPDFDVWFAPLRLTIGDSLLREISKGLHECDYGVVIFSPAFFSKEWPQHELDGLFALESSERKVVLPIWKDVTKAQVAQFSPIIAGRLAALASEGIASVVRHIRIAIETGTRMSALSAGLALDARFRSLDAREQHRKRAEVLMATQDGADRARTAVSRLVEALEKRLTDLSATSANIKIGCKRDARSLSAGAPYRRRLVVCLLHDFLNSLSEAELRVAVYQIKSRFDKDSLEDRVCVKTSYRPYFDPSEEVIWRDESDNTFSSAALEDAIIDSYIAELEQAQAATTEK